MTPLNGLCGLHQVSGLLFKNSFLITDCCTTDFLSSPTCHLFVCGAPCQPYSKAGLQKALEDPKSGQVLLWILAWIAAHKPEAFILENVEGLCSTHKEILAIILGVLSQLLDSKGKKLYHVEHRLLNLCTHGSIPQNRPRLFVVGLRVDRLNGREFSQTAPKSQDLLASRRLSYALNPKP